MCYTNQIVGPNEINLRRDGTGLVFEAVVSRSASDFQRAGTGCRRCFKVVKRA